MSTDRTVQSRLVLHLADVTVDGRRSDAPLRDVDAARRDRRVAP